MSNKLSDFQRKRLENIKRNNDLLKSLNLKQLPSVPSPQPTKADRRVYKPKISKNGKKARKIATEELPRRRNTRSRTQIKIPDSFRGIDEKNIEQILLNQNDPLSKDNSKEAEQLMKEMDDIQAEIERKKNFRIAGDIKLGDLIGTDKLVHTDLSRLSAGDFFKKKEHEEDAELASKVKKEFVDDAEDDLFDNLKLYPFFPPNEIKIVNSRITSLFFHPLTDGPKLIVGGDKEGMLGFWNVKETAQSESEGEIPDITNFNLFKSNVGNIGLVPNKVNELFVSSYDGSFRIMDLNGLNCREVFYLNPALSGYNGISDLKFLDPNLIYFTTLSGEFFKHDLRMKFDESGNNIPLKLADKKIGSMDIDPTNSNTIATGSLDRTLKIWDVRNPIKNENPDLLSTANIIKQYDSRLSISAVSYSPSDHTLVCNGYDNTIRLFDSLELNNNTVEMNPTNTITHNCKTGKWTSILKARFKSNENLFSIANMSRAIDIYKSNGIQIAHLETATVPAVTAWHPTQNWIAGGNASGKVFLFTDVY